MPKSKKPKAELLVMGKERDPMEMLEELVNRKVEQLLANQASAVFEPFFRDKRAASAIRKLQDVHWQRKFSYYYEDWGCMICRDTSAPHTSLGMCAKCLSREKARIATSVRRREPDAKPLTKHQDLRARAASVEYPEDKWLDLEAAAKTALAPAIEVLARPKK